LVKQSILRGIELIMDTTDFDIRYTEPEDLVYLTRWMKSPGILHWFPIQSEKEIEEALQGWISFYRLKCSITAIRKGEPCAIGTLFLMPYKKMYHQCSFKIIVDPSQQRQGIGTSMIKNLKHLAKNYFNLEMINIDVYEKNPLIELLKKNGFYELAFQQNYAKENGSYLGRLLMETQL
jgi:RimJ/RimL family protein N-acetyltransferase